MINISFVIDAVKQVYKYGKKVFESIDNLAWKIIDKYEFCKERELHICLYEKNECAEYSYIIYEFGKMNTSYQELMNLLDNEDIELAPFRYSFQNFKNLKNMVYEIEDWNGYNANLNDFDVRIEFLQDGIQYHID